MDFSTHSTKLIIILLIVLLISACSSQDQNTPTVEQPDTPLAAKPAYGGHLTDASIGDASNLIPMIAGDSSSHEVAGQLYLALLKYDRNLNLAGQLAESWEISDDQLSITFKLRDHIKWTDGLPFTSADCAFTLALIQNPLTQSAYQSDYAKVARFETPDALTFRVFYSEPYSPALSSWSTLSILPKHVFKNEDIMNTRLSRQPKATLGPYRLTDWQPQQSITLLANRNYYDGDVWIDKRITRIIPDLATQFLELSAGSIDSMGLTPIQYQRLFDTKPALKKNYNRYKYLKFVYTYLGFNLTRKPFDDIRVRQALAFAIDRQELVDGVLLGLGETIAAPYKPGTYWVNEQLKPRTYNVNKAKELLASAGWKDSDGDGILDKDGKPFKFTILTNNGNKQRADSATIIQQRLKDVGIKVAVRLVEWSAFIENFINKRNFEVVLLGWQMTPEPDQYSIWHSSQTGARQFNFLSYNNPEVDKALVAATRTFDNEKRKKYYDIVQQNIYNDVPIIFLYAPYSLPVMHKRIHGIEPAPAGIAHNSEKWFVPLKMQTHQTGITP